jgi:hypothetical protein
MPPRKSNYDAHSHIKQLNGTMPLHKDGWLTLMGNLLRRPLIIHPKD